MAKFFKKSEKPYLGTILGPFSPNLGKNEFSWKKKPLSVFKYSNYLPACHFSQWKTHFTQFIDTFWKF